MTYTLYDVAMMAARCDMGCEPCTAHVRSAAPALPVAGRTALCGRAPWQISRDSGSIGAATRGSRQHDSSAMCYSTVTMLLSATHRESPRKQRNAPRRLPAATTSSARCGKVLATIAGHQGIIAACEKKSIRAVQEALLSTICRVETTQTV
jgi:hypothetical protein